jgi:hypothetical protein
MFGLDIHLRRFGALALAGLLLAPVLEARERPRQVTKSFCRSGSCSQRRSSCSQRRRSCNRRGCTRCRRQQQVVRPPVQRPPVRRPPVQRSPYRQPDPRAYARMVQIQNQQMAIIARLMQQIQRLEQRLAVAEGYQRRITDNAYRPPQAPSTTPTPTPAPSKPRPPAHPIPQVTRAPAGSFNPFGIPMPGATPTPTPAPTKPEQEPVITPSAPADLPQVAALPLAYTFAQARVGEPGLFTELEKRLVQDYAEADKKDGAPDPGTLEFRNQFVRDMRVAAQMEARLLARGERYRGRGGRESEDVQDIRQDIQHLQYRRHELLAVRNTRDGAERDRAIQEIARVETELKEREQQLAEYTQGQAPSGELVIRTALATLHGQILRRMVGNLRKVESDGDPIHASLYAAWKVKRGVFDHAIALAKGSMS